MPPKNYAALMHSWTFNRKFGESQYLTVKSHLW